MLNGFLNLYKPRGITSNKAISFVRKALNTKKIGHAGTLDPLAEGVLPLAFNEATKVIQFVVDGEKEYEFTVKWGEATTTDDMEGEVTEKNAVIPDEKAIKEILKEFTGTIEQVPPIYSAIKINGKRAHDLARKGMDAKDIDIKPRKVLIHSLELLGDKDIKDNTYKGKEYSSFRVRCGKGTYVRALARDIAKSLGTFAHVVFLKRTMVANKFISDDAIDIKTLDNMGDKVVLNKAWVSIEKALGDILAVSVGDLERLRKFYNGLKITLDAHDFEAGVDLGKVTAGVHVLVKTKDGTEVGLGVFTGSGLTVAPMKRFNIIDL